MEMQKRSLFRVKVAATSERKSKLEQAPLSALQFGQFGRDLSDCRNAPTAAPPSLIGGNPLAIPNRGSLRKQFDATALNCEVGAPLSAVEVG